MKECIEHLNASDYDELLGMLNTVFHKTSENSFDMQLPVMWERNDTRMGRHLAIRRNGRIIAVAGVYPLPAVIAGESVLFGTIGNIATMPQYRCHGMMKQLMNAALQEAVEMGMDVARLSGLRQRYNRYGFENGGADIYFTLTRKNLQDYFDGAAGRADPYEPRLAFRQVLQEDTELLQFVMQCQRQADMYVDRGDAREYYKTLTAYKNRIWAAFDGNETVGYLAAGENGADISEHRAVSTAVEKQMLCDWAVRSETNVTFHTAPWECDLTREMSRFCEKWTVGDASHFHPFHWDKLLNALMKVRAKHWDIPDGSFVLRIEEYGTLLFEGDTCVRTEMEPQMTLSHLDAVRFLLGTLPPADVASCVGMNRKHRLYVQSVFPLPLGWCNQDRV